MTRDELGRVMTQVMEEIRLLRDAGQKEYAHDEDNAFANFERIGMRLDLDRKAVLLTYALKHLDGIVAYVKGHKSQREDVRGRINDLIVYMVLLRGMVDEADGKLPGTASDSIFPLPEVGSLDYVDPQTGEPLAKEVGGIPAAQYEYEAFNAS